MEEVCQNLMQLLIQQHFIPFSPNHSEMSLVAASGSLVFPHHLAAQGLWNCNLP